jgi:hypothetical protein
MYAGISSGPVALNGESQLLITIDDIAQNMEEGDQTDIILLDFAKAFDKVPHDRLLHQMEFYGVRQNTLNHPFAIFSPILLVMIGRFVGLLHLESF